MSNQAAKPLGVYVFHGEGSKFASAVYADVHGAQKDIERFRMSGILTWYPLGETVFHFAVANGLFQPKDEISGDYIQKFTSGKLEHYHYRNGELS